MRIRSAASTAARAALVSALMAIAGPGVASEPPLAVAPATAAQCELAELVAVNLAKGRPGALADFGDGPVGLADAQYVAKEEVWPKDRPSPALAALFGRTPQTGPLRACPGMADRLRAAGLPPASDFPPKAKSRPRYLHSMALPVISEDGTEALVSTAYVCGGLCGAGTILHLRKGPDGRWKVVDELGTWIS